MRAFCCLVAACAACVSCHREADAPRAPKSAASPKTNVVSKLDDKGWLSETIVYETNGVLKQRTVYVTAADGRILTARTVDSQGRSKWTDKYSYSDASNRRPVEIQRLKADGQLISVRFLSFTNGAERRIVTGPDGKQISEAEQAAFLGE
jgi:hypothetical protein